MRNGRLRFAPGVTRMIDGVRRVRYLPNHRLDLLTVDETTRLMANMVVKTFDHGSMLGGGDEKGERDGFRAERAARTEDEGADDEVDDPT